MGHDSRCVNCGLDIEKDYILLINGTEYTFDSFECAINFVAPRCTNCNSIITGRGVHVGNEVYCSSTCSHAVNYSPVIP
jgi:hypothetical protein